VENSEYYVIFLVLHVAVGLIPE